MQDGNFDFEFPVERMVGRNYNHHGIDKLKEVAGKHFMFFFPFCR